jgi:hypothetical protein
MIKHLGAAVSKSLLGLHPGNSIDVYAAVLAGSDLTEATAQLDALHGEGLLTEAGHRRYGMHDLIRRYSRDRAAAPAADRGRALDRLLDYYQHTAASADVRLARQTRPAPALAVLPAPPAEVPGLGDASAALVWARVERDNLLACLNYASADQHARVIALTAAVAALLRRDGPWPDAITATPAPRRPHGISATGSARPAPSTIWAMCGG